MKKTIFVFALLAISSCSYFTKDPAIEDPDMPKTQEELENEAIESLLDEIQKIEEEYLKELESLAPSDGNTHNEILEQEDQSEIPEAMLLDIKFYSQSVGGNWQEPYQNFCEEASFLNAYYFLTHQTPSIQEYDKDLWAIKKIQDDLLPGGYKDTSIQDTLTIAQEFLIGKEKIIGTIIENPTIEIIKENIAQGHPVLVPVHGKGLNNPYFTNGGPVYHNFIIKGYDSENFIVNEVGLTNGNSFKYSQELVMKNIYNFDTELYPDNFLKGKQAILVFQKISDNRLGK